jgi:hypothetical protein
MKTNYPQTLSTLGTQDTGWKETIQRHCQHPQTRYRMEVKNQRHCQHWAQKIQDGSNQSRDTCQHWAHKTQDGNKQFRDTVNTRHTLYRKKTNNIETLSTLFPQDTGWKQTIRKHTTQKTEKMSNTDPNKRLLLNIIEHKL